jgi:hypothetical protein
MPQHEIVPSPIAKGPKPFLPAILQLPSGPRRYFYVGGFLVGFALSGVIGVALYAVL